MYLVPSGIPVMLMLDLFHLPFISVCFLYNLSKILCTFQFHFPQLLSSYILTDLLFFRVSSSLVTSCMTFIFCSRFIFLFYLFPRSEALVFIPFCEINFFAMHLHLYFEFFPYSGDIFLWISLVKIIISVAIYLERMFYPSAISFPCFFLPFNMQYFLV